MRFWIQHIRYKTMAELFHINPKTGRVNKCTASEGNCPYGVGAIHESTKEAAQARYEQAMVHQLVPKSFSKKDASPGMDEVGNVYPLSAKELVLLRRRLRGSVLAKDFKKMEIGPSTTAHVSYNRNGEASFDYNDYETQELFSKGACGYLAFAIHEKTGLPFTIVTADPESPYWAGHMAIKLGEDSFLDITGTNSMDEIVRRYSLDPKKLAIEQIDSSEIFQKARGIKEGSGVYDNLDELERAILDRLSRDLIRDFC